MEWNLATNKIRLKVEKINGWIKRKKKKWKWKYLIIIDFRKRYSDKY